MRAPFPFKKQNTTHLNTGQAQKGEYSISNILVVMGLITISNKLSRNESALAAIGKWENNNSLELSPG